MNLEEKFKKKEAEFNRVHRQWSDLKWRYEKQMLRPRAEKLVGTVWKTENNYSCPNGPEDIWTLYKRIVRISSTGFFETQQMQIDKYGKVEIEQNKLESWERFIRGDLAKATKSEWNSELKRCRSILNKFELS